MNCGLQGILVQHHPTSHVGIEHKGNYRTRSAVAKRYTRLLAPPLYLDPCRHHDADVSHQLY